MGNRVARPLERLLKIKSIDPDHNFVGADKRVYDEFLKKQAQETLLDEIDAEIEVEKPKKKKSKKVKQVIPVEEVETGETEFNEEIDVVFHDPENSVSPSESN